ncbi:MAG: LamG domain-containing protein [Limisphaerales bacterium]
MKQSTTAFGLFWFALLLLLGWSSNAQSTATATATLFNDFVVAITVTDGGSGYGWAPLVTIIGGGGTGAAAVATVSNGVVTSITVTNAGFDYTNGPQVTIAAPDTTLFNSSLVLDLPLAGSVIDVGPFNFTVVTNGGGTFVPNRFALANSALSLNGVNQNLAIPYDARLYPDEMTLSAWVNFQQFNGVVWRAGNATSDGWRGFSVQFSPDLGYQDYTGSSGNASVSVNLTNFVLNRWYQIVITRTTNSVAMYVNGVNMDSQTGLTPYTQPQVTPMSLGADNADPSGFYRYCPVTLNAVHIYNRALADSEVSNLYTNEAAGLVPMLGVVVKTIRINMTQLVAGQTYQLETSTNLPSWTDLGSSFVATNSTAFEDVDIIGTTIGLFRVVELP